MIGQRLLLAGTAVLAMTVIAAGAAFLIAPVWQPGYRPAAYSPAVVQDQQKSGSASSQWPEQTADTVLIDLNSADAKTLERLPGIGEKKAAAIVEDRRLNGPFSSLEDVCRVKGVSDKTVRQWEGLAEIR